MYNEFDKEEFMTDEDELGDPKKNSGLGEDGELLEDETAEDEDNLNDEDEEVEDPKADEEEGMI